MDRRLKRPSSDGKPSESSQRQRVEGQISRGFASGEAGRRSTRFRPIAHSQEIHERHENSSFEVPASQQIGTEYLLELRGQIQQANQLLQDTYHQNQTVLEHLDQQVAKIQQDTRALENSFHPPARNEQSMPQHQQEEVFDIHDYLNLSSDSDYESDQRELLEAHEAKGIALIQSSTSHSSDAPFQKHPLDNLKHKGQIEQRRNNLVQQHEVYNQAGSSRQGDTRLDAEDSKILEHYTEYILSVKKWDNSINILEFGQKEFFSGLVSNFPMETIQQAEQVRKDQHDAGKSDHLRSQGQVEQGQATLSQRHEGHDQAGPSDQTKAASEQERPWTKQDLHQFFVELAQTKNFNPKAIQDSLSEECKVIWMQLQTKNGPCLNDQEKGDMEHVFRAYGIPPTDKKCLYMRDKTEHRRKQKHKSDMKRNNIARSQGYKNATDMRYCKK